MATATKIRKPLKIWSAAPCEIKFADGKDAISDDVEIIRVGTYFHPAYGKMEITRAHLDSFVKNFNENIRKIDLAVDYMHQSDGVSAAWFKSVYVGPDGNSLRAKVDWTANAKKVLGEKEFRYLSAEFVLSYKDNETLKEHGPTLLGAGLTNRPFIKGMEPVIPLSDYAEGQRMPMTVEEIMTKMQQMDGAIQKLQAEKTSAAAAAPNASGVDPDAVADATGVDDLDAASDTVDDNQDPNATGDEVGDSGDDGAKDYQTKKAAYGEMQKNLADKKAELDAHPSAPGVKTKVPPKVPPVPGKKPPAPAADDKEKQMSEAKMQEVADARIKKLSEESAAKNAQFVKLLTEHKAVEAQREAFLSGDMIKFAELAQPAPKTERVSSAADDNGPITDGNAAADKLIVLAEAKAKEKNISVDKALSMVLADPANKALREAHEKIFS